MRVGIVGTGFMGQVHAAAWADTPAEIVGFVSKDDATAVTLTQKYNTKRYPDLATMLSDVDVVDICTPTHLHHAMTIQAAKAGKHVVCEKPLARSLPEAREMISVCRQVGVKLMVAHVVRFFPEYAKAKEQVDAGVIGETAVLRLRRGSSQPKKAVDNWFLETEKSGGMILDLMIHDFDYARWVAGDVVQVYAQNISNAHPGAPVDHCLAILTHKSGAISHIEGSWAYPPPLFRTALEIAGSNGLIQNDSERVAAIDVHLHARDGEAPDVALPGSPLLESPYTTQIKSFYDHLAFDTPLRVTADDGYRALEIALAAFASAASGQPVQLGEEVAL